MARLKNFWLVGRLLCAFLLVVIAQNTAYSQQQKLSISSVNDNWGWGYTQIKDDYRSFGFLAQYDFNWKDRWAQVALQNHSFTNRLSSDSSRLDELALQLKIPLHQAGAKLKINALAGGYYTGNLSGEAIQNVYHTNLGVKEVNLPYPDKNKTHLLVGGQLEYLIFTSEKTRFFNQISAQAQYHIAPNYLSSFTTRIHFNRQNAYLDNIGFSLGYNHQEVFSAGARRASAKVESGFFAQYAHNLGLAHFELMVYPGTNFSTGTLGLNLLNWHQRKTLEKVDFTAEYGAYLNEMGLYQRYLIPLKAVKNNTLQVDIHQQFWRINGSLNPDFPEQFGHFQQTSLGVNYSPFGLKRGWQLLPYLSGRLGYQSQSIYSGESNFKSLSTFSLNLIGEIGLRLKLKANFIHNNCYYGLSSHYSFTQAYYQAEADKNNTTNYNFNLPNEQLGFGLFVMIDL